MTKTEILYKFLFAGQFGEIPIGILINFWEEIYPISGEFVKFPYPLGEFDKFLQFEYV